MALISLNTCQTSVSLLFLITCKLLPSPIELRSELEIIIHVLISSHVDYCNCIFTCLSKNVLGTSAGFSDHCCEASHYIFQVLMSHHCSASYTGFPLIRICFSLLELFTDQHLSTFTPHTCPAGMHGGKRRPPRTLCF